MPALSKILPTKRINSYPFRKETIDVYVPESPGIYIFWSGLFCVYVGQAKNLKDRLSTHWRKSHNDDVNTWINALGSNLSISFEVVGKDLFRAEQAFIDRFNPHLNKINARTL
jgi:excinuclease UvrABC nuclease subunit